MAYAERHTVSITTDASGDSTDYTPVVTAQGGDTKTGSFKVIVG